MLTAVNINESLGHGFVKKIKDPTYLVKCWILCNNNPKLNKVNVSVCCLCTKKIFCYLIQSIFERLACLVQTNNSTNVILSSREEKDNNTCWATKKTLPAVFQSRQSEDKRLNVTAWQNETNREQGGVALTNDTAGVVYEQQNVTSLSLFRWKEFSQNASRVFKWQKHLVSASFSSTFFELDGCFLCVRFVSAGCRGDVSDVGPGPEHSGAVCSTSPSLHLPFLPPQCPARPVLPPGSSRGLLLPAGGTPLRSCRPQLSGGRGGPRRENPWTFDNRTVIANDPFKGSRRTLKVQHCLI